MIDFHLNEYEQKGVKKVVKYAKYNLDMEYFTKIV